MKMLTIPWITSFALLFAAVSFTIQARAQTLPATDAHWQALSRAPGIMVGSRGITGVQVVFDPNCHYSRKLFLHLKTTESATPIRWVPVAYFKPSSAHKAAAILAAPRPDVALHENFKGYDFAKQLGAAAVHVDPARFRRDSREWHDIWRQDYDSTPLIFARSADGRVWYRQGMGEVEGIAALIRQAGGLKGYTP